MLALMLVSLAAVAGVSLVFNDPGDDEAAEEDQLQLEDEEEALTQQADGLSVFDTATTFELIQDREDVVAADEDLTSDQTEGPTETTEASGEASTINSEVPDDLGSIEYDNNGLVYLSETGTEQITELDAGDGDDTITVVSGVANITTGEGADSVDASGMSAGVIIAGSGDAVIGSNVVDANEFFPTQRVGVELHDDATFSGGAAHEYIAAFGDGAEASGGAGNDILLSFEGSTTLQGGEGDDTIDSHAFDSEYSQNSRFGDTGADGFTDLVDGGEGDDRLFVGGGDTVTGGSGADQIIGSYPLGQGSEPMTVTDYSVKEDQLWFQVAGYDAVLDEAGEDNFDPNGRFEILESDGDSHVFVDDELVAVLEGANGVTATAEHVPNLNDGGFHGLLLRIA
ncbi:MAG: hypothetical protein AB8B71_19155 [Paracoccaceae bacterium]